MQNGTTSAAPGSLALAVLLASATLTVMAGATIAPSPPGLAIALSAPFAGVLLDRASKRNVLVLAMALYTVAGSSGLYLDSLNLILVGRMFLGLAVGIIMTASVSLVADLWQGERRGEIMGWQGAAMSFGGVLFVGSGLFLDQLSYGLIGPPLVSAGGLHFVCLAMGLVAAALSATLIVVTLRSRLIRPTTILLF